MFLEILQNSQENTCARGLQLYLKIDSGTGVFLWILQNFWEHLRTTVSVTKPTFELQIFHVIMTFLQSSEAATGGVLLEKVFLKISQIS